MDFIRQNCCKEGKNGSIGPKSHGRRFLQGIIFADYLEKGRATRGQSYADLLKRFNAYLIKKRPHLVKKVLFSHGNAPAHSSAIVTAKLVKLSYKLLPQLPYSPDFASCNSCRTRKLSPKQRPILWSSTNHTFLDRLKKLEYGWTKCIELKKYYIEK